jgi:hypothetical protein
MFKNTIRTVGLCLLFGVVAIPGVWANWVYCDPQESAQGDVGVKIGTWPEDIVLPGKPEDTEEGMNYLMLLEAILHSKKSGLNPTDLLENAIWNTKKNSDHLGLLYSSQNVTGGNQAHLFDKDTANGTASLLFAIESIEGSKTEYYVYMYKKKDAETAILQNNLSKSSIFAYRALVKYENGKWSAMGVMTGYGYVYKPPGDSFNGLKTDTWVSY